MKSWKKLVKLLNLLIKLKPNEWKKTNASQKQDKNYVKENPSIVYTNFLQKITIPV